MTIAQPTSSTGRPVAITVICIVSVIGIALGLLGFVATLSVLGEIAIWIPVYLGVVILVNAVSTYGLWMMKKWALYLYTATFVVSQIVTFTVGTFSLIGLVIPLVVLGVCWAYQARMT
jgi:hypothetical protein